ncbi:TonB-dependent receptor [Bacteroides sp.]|uniref:TonB-dependent receptor n=1 Tax=Bacteroides sp. TaxID=29523 RepID=UPI00262C89BE|nr:TonB-dependent receptor [Bacteroides sp.]
MLKRVRLILTVALLLMAVGVNAQITTASLAGKVTDASKEPIIGATVQAIHMPSGSQYGTVTNVDGRYSIQGMRTGGPYKVTISYIGYQTVVYQDITLQLGEVYNLDVEMTESSELLGEVVVTGTKTKFSAEKTGATTNINSAQINQLPTVNRSISDIARLSPYANGMSFAGGDGRSTNFTIDGANFNNNFGLSSNLPGGGNPISMDAIEEVQVVVAPFDVRQTNFIGGGINAITKSGTNSFRGTAYTYYRNQDMRGNRINGEDLGARADESKTTYGFTLGGPIIKNKLFFFVNYEKETTPGEVIKYRAREAGEKVDGMVSRTLKSDMEKVSKHLMDKYGYNTGSYTSFPADEENTKLLARIDWNITDRHRLSLRYNNTKNIAWNAPNGNSSDTGKRLSDNRVGPNSMSFANSMYSQDNKVQSWAADLNSRFTDKISNQLLFTYTSIEDMRGTNSSPFPFIDIMAGKGEDGKQLMESYISAGYELFTYNNGVNNKVTSIIDNFTFFTGNHKITAGISYEHQFANNAYMRNGTGYYRYNSLDDFLNGAAPESFALTYGFNGNANPKAQVTFNQLGFYAQDEWNVNNRLKLTYGIRFDNLMFDDKDIQRNDAIYALDFGGKKIDTGKWPGSNMQFSPRIGFSWDILGDKSLKMRGGTGVFTGRLPLVFFTNMPTNSNMLQNSVTFITDYGKGIVDPRLAQLAGGMITDMNQVIEKFNLPTTIEKHVAGSKISGVVEDFKMPQVWKSSIALDYQVPVSFPLTVTGEFMFTKNINAVTINNINIQNPDAWKYNKVTTTKGPDGKDVNTTELLHTGMQRFNGADNRMIYSYSPISNTDKNVKYTGDYVYYSGKNAVVMDNTSKGYGYTANITVNAQPVDNLMAMLAYTHTESKELSGLPGSDPVSTWTNLNTIDGPNFVDAQRSQYVVPDKVIASVSYYIPFRHKGLLRGTHLNLFYAGYSSNGYSFMYSNDMNGDGSANDLMYIPKDDSEIKFKTDDDRVAFWNFVEQDSYLKNHKGEYAEAYAARAPWVHRFDFRLMEDFEFKIGKTKHNIQLSFDIMNVGNLINSKWGISKTNTVSNNNRILKYEGVTSDKDLTPVYSMYKVNGEYPTKTYDTYQNYSECWKLQVGIRYIFN